MSELFIPNECELMSEVFQDLDFSFEDGQAYRINN